MQPDKGSRWEFAFSFHQVREIFDAQCDTHKTRSRLALIGFVVTGAPDDGTRRALVAGVETDLSCSTMGCVIVPLPLRRRVSGAAHPRSSHRPWPSPLSAGLGTRLSPAIAGWVTTRIQDSLRTDRPLARRPRRLCHGDSTVGSLLPPATSYGPLGRYPDRTLTGKSIAASRTHQKVHTLGAVAEPSNVVLRVVVDDQGVGWP